LKKIECERLVSEGDSLFCGLDLKELVVELGLYFGFFSVKLIG